MQHDLAGAPGTHPNRRQALQRSARVAALLAAAGALPALAQAQAPAWDKGAFEAKSMSDLMRALGAGAPVESRDVTVTGPDIAENGAVVPLGASTALPGVRRMLLLVEKNPNVLAAMFDVTDAVDASFSTRAKMGQSSNVFAVAQMADGRVLFAGKEVKVTLGGCGG